MSAKVMEPKPHSPAPVRTTLTPAPSRALLRQCACSGSPTGGDCESCRTKHPLQRHASGAAPMAMPPIVGSVLRSPGSPIDPGTRSFMESRFGHDFSQVRVHHDAMAAESARTVNAHAYTIGNDIVFAPGKYDPHSPAGRHLLAHELAHTVQQSGVAFSSADGALVGAQDSQLEHEAEAAARALDPEPLRATGLPTRTASPVLSRAAAGPDTAPAGESEPIRDWEDAPAALQVLGVRQLSKTRPGAVSAKVRAFRLETFSLPIEKGPVVDAWKKRALAGGLESFIDTAGTARAALKQERPSTDTLRNLWLAKVGWSKDQAAELWTAAGGDSRKTFEPKVGGKTCQMDHIVELQIGGNNTTENIQCLDEAENAKSGRDIFTFLKDKAQRIRGVAKDIDEVVLHFDEVVQAGATCKAKTCCAVEQAALAMTKAKAAEGKAAVEDSEPYELVAASATTLRLPKGSLKPKKATTVPLAESSEAQNRGASTLIPGMILNELRLTTKGHDQVHAFVDTENPRTRLPITIDKAKGVVPLSVDATTHELKLVNKHPHIAFTYPYLSRGTITELNQAPEGLSGKGKLTPSIPLLRRLELGVSFSPGRFEVTAGIDPKKITPPIPGAHVTKAELGLELFPEFKPSGTFEFEYAPGGKKLADASLRIEKDAGGLVALGKMHAYLPGVDQAEGEVAYRNRAWSGGIRIESTQIKLPYVKSGVVVVAFDDKGVHPDGTVVLELPGSNLAEVRLRRAGAKWVFTGKGLLKIPRLEDTTILVVYDGETLRGEGKTRFTFYGLKGRLEVDYVTKSGGEGKVSGKGEIDIEKGRAKGKLMVKMSPAQRFSGEGSITYRVSENLIATVGAILDEREKLRLKGALEFPKPIPLFKPFRGDKELFKAGISIPVPGASIGPIGLVIRIDGALGARYGIGPGELRNAKIEAALDPLEDKPDLDVQMGAMLFIPAYAGIYGSVRGAIAIDAKLASVSGGLTVIASADLDGKVQAAVLVHYQKSRFDLKADSEISAGLMLGLKLDADVTAEAGIGPFTVKTQKVWHLAAFRYDTGLKFGMKAKLYYASDQPFKPPSLDDIEWIKPELKVGDMLEKILKGGGKEGKAA